MIFHILTVILVLLQVLGVISVSWWLVVAPSLIIFSFQIIVLMAAVLWAWRAVDADKRD